MRRSLLSACNRKPNVSVTGCNARGEEGGQSYVFDPMGTLLAKTENHSAAARSLDFAMVRSVRKRMHYLDDAVLLSGWLCRGVHTAFAGTVKFFMMGKCRVPRVIRHRPGRFRLRGREFPARHRVYAAADTVICGNLASTSAPLHIVQDRPGS